MRGSIKLLCLSLGLVFAQTALAAEDYLDVDKLYGDFAADAGNEVAVPRWTFIDLDADGYPDRVRVLIDTYTAGTNLPVASSTPLLFLTPALPAGCSPQQAADELNLDPRIQRRTTPLPDSDRIHIIMGMSTWCDTGAGVWVDSYRTNIYSANAGRADPAQSAPWKYSSPYQLVGANGIDTDGDGTTETIAVLQGIPLDAQRGNGLLTTITGSDGTVTSNVSYPVMR